MTAADLAARVGIARSTLQLVEKGDPKVEIGTVLEAAVLVGVPLFTPEGGTSVLAAELGLSSIQYPWHPQSPND